MSQSLTRERVTESASSLDARFNGKTARALMYHKLSASEFLENGVNHKAAPSNQGERRTLGGERVTR